ncbi:MAG TPA: hypothetical protein VKR58_05780 [Aquella sp.]|nr:hypothetical protein [Aquella sp.]
MPLVNSVLSSPQWQKYTVPYTSLQTAALTNAITLFTLPIKGTIHALEANVTTAFSGTTTCTCSVGIVGNLVKFMAATTVLSTGVINGVSLSVTDIESMSATTIIQINAIATVQNLSSLTQGSIDVYVLVGQLN